jgi:hypothetical protein
LLIDLLFIKSYVVEQEQKIAARHRRSKQQIEELLNLFAKSNSGVKDFCREHNISPANFHKWKSRYRSKPQVKKNASGFARMDIVSLPGLFAEVNGIKLYQPVSAAYLKELVA